MPQSLNRRRWSHLALLVLVAHPALAALHVSRDAPEAELLRGDRIVALSSDDANWKVDDPLAFEQAWLECSAQPQCQITIERRNEPQTRPLWAANVEMQLGPALQHEAANDVELEQLANERLADGQFSAAAWASMMLPRRWTAR